MRVVEFLSKLLKRDAVPRDPPVIFDERCFQRVGPSGFTAAWSDVLRITGYKIDMLCWDEIRMEFALATGVRVVVTEESPGFQEFMREVERRFESAQGWHGRVALPAFEPNTSVLYDASN